MQILNVGAGRTDEEYKLAEQQRLNDLRVESNGEANYFFWAAGLSALSTGLLPIRISGFVNIGTVDLLRAYGGSLGSVYPLMLYSMAALWLVVLLGLGLAARSGHRWAFLAGMALYGLDMISLMALFSLWSFGVHAFFLFRWFHGQKALKELSRAAG